MVMSGNTAQINAPNGGVLAVKGVDANHTVLATDSAILGSVISRPVAIAGGGFNPKSAHAEDWEGTAHAYVYSGSDYVAQGGMLSPSGSSHRHSSGVTHDHAGFATNFLSLNQTGDILIGFSRTSGSSTYIGSQGHSFKKGYFQAYKWNGTSWVDWGMRNDSNSTLTKTYFGNSGAVSWDGNIVACAAYQRNSTEYDVGSVCIFEHNNNSTSPAWDYRNVNTTKWWRGNASQEDDAFGTTVAMDSTGNKLITLSGSLSTSRSGYRFIVERYEWNGSQYNYTHTLNHSITDSEFDSGESFQGNAILAASKDASVVLIGGETKVQVMHLVGNSYVAKGAKMSKYFMDGDGQSYWSRTACISSDGNTIAIKTSSTTVTIYDWNGSSWASAGTVSGDAVFGTSLALYKNDYLLVGGGFADRNVSRSTTSPEGEEADAGFNKKGNMKAYLRSGNSWVQDGSTMYGRNEAGAEFGSAVAVAPG